MQKRIIPTGTYQEGEKYYTRPLDEVKEDDPRYKNRISVNHVINRTLDSEEELFTLFSDPNDRLFVIQAGLNYIQATRKNYLLTGDKKIPEDQIIDPLIPLRREWK